MTKNRDVFGAMFFFPFMYLHFIPLSHFLFNTFDYDKYDEFFTVSVTFFVTVFNLMVLRLQYNLSQL